jgi:hypothetical protein
LSNTVDKGIVKGIDGGIVDKGIVDKGIVVGKGIDGGTLVFIKVIESIPILKTSLQDNHFEFQLFYPNFMNIILFDRIFSTVL